MLRERLFLISVLLALLVVVFHLTWAHHGLKDLLVLRQQEIELRAQCGRMADENAVLRAQIENLRSNDEYLQSLIRRKLGLVRGDELVYRFGSEQPPPTR